MTFSTALELIKAGYVVRRKSKSDRPLLFVQPNHNQGYIGYFNSGNRYLPVTTDLLADDWEIFYP